MTSFIVMQNRIVSDIVRDDLVQQVKDHINDAIAQWEGERFNFNERRYLISTVASQEYYALIAPTLLTFQGAAVPTGETVLEFDSITATINNMPYRLTPRTQQWFDDYQALPSQYIGQPDSYAIFNDQIRLFPIPDNVYPLNISCLARLGPNPLTADGDTNSWMTEGAKLIREQAKMTLCRDVLGDSQGKTNASEAVVETQWSLKRKMAAKVFTGTQRAWNL